MIIINEKEFVCLDLIEREDSGIEYLEVYIEGELGIKENKVKIKHKGKEYYGFKLIPHFANGVTKFLVYIFQPGDSEASGDDNFYDEI